MIVSSAVSAQEISHDDPILGSAPEQSLQGGSPIPGGPGFISVSTFAFKPYDSMTDQSYTGTQMFNGSNSSGYYFAPINLPHGATITKVVFFYFDQVLADLSLYLVRVNLFDGSTQNVAGAIPTGNAGQGFIESTLYLPVVDNQLYSYILEVVIPGSYGSNLRLINVRIDYSYPAYLPTVMK